MLPESPGTTAPIEGDAMQDFRVKTFLTVCRTLNYTRAAEELALTQPAVSQHITCLLYTS